MNLDKADVIVFRRPSIVIHYDYQEIREKPQDEWQNYEMYQGITHVILYKDKAVLLGEMEKILDIEETAVDLQELFTDTGEETVLLLPKRI